LTAYKYHWLGRKIICHFGQQQGVLEG